MIKRNFDIASHLCAEGADTEVATKKGWTPLHYCKFVAVIHSFKILKFQIIFLILKAVKNDDLLFVGLLCEKMKNLEQRTSNGSTALNIGILKFYLNFRYFNIELM